MAGRTSARSLADIAEAAARVPRGRHSDVYPVPALIALFAAGAVHAESTSRGRGRRPAVIVLSGLIAVLIGWPEFAGQVKSAKYRIPPGTPVFTSFSLALRHSG